MGIKKRAQEEMVGFALIIIIVAVVLVIFLGLYLNKPVKEGVESYEANSFLQATMGYTTNCETNRNSHPSVKELITDCYGKKECLNGEDSCEVLDSTLRGILDESWKVGENRPYEGYELNISMKGEKIVNIKEGGVSGESRGSSLLGTDPEISFIVYFKSSSE